MENVVIKYCKFCQINKPVSEYYTRMGLLHNVSNKCKSCSCFHSRQWTKNNKEKNNLRAARWARENPEKRKKSVNKYDQKNIEEKRRRGREDNKKRRQLDLDGERKKGAYYSQVRRARVNNLKSTITQARLKKIFHIAKGRCVYCGKESKLTIDHFTPIISGGENVAYNIIPCCKSCNSSKNKYEGSEWLFNKFGLDGLRRAINFCEKSYKTKLI